MIQESTATHIFDIALQGGADFAELYAERWRKRTLRVIDNELADANSGIEYGCGLRLFYGTDVVYAYTNDLSEDALADLVSTLARLRGEQGKIDASGRGGLDFRRSAATGSTCTQTSFGHARQALPARAFT